MAWIKTNWAWLLIFSFLVLLPTKTGFNIAFGVMAVLGLLRVIQTPSAVTENERVQLMLLLFLLIWIPMLLALPDATNIEHSFLTVLKFVRFPLAGIFMVLVLQEPENQNRLLLAAAALCLFWCFDALVQFFIGVNLFGHESSERRLQGMFYKYRLGICLSVTLPIVILAVQNLRGRWPNIWLVLTLPITVILMTGSRSAWLMMIVVSLAYGILALSNQGLQAFSKRTGIKILVVITLGSLLAIQFPGLYKRAEQTAQIFSTDRETINTATAFRLSIWEPALNIAKAHWINGIGPRSFRYEFVETTPPENFWMKRTPPGVTHPHLTALEIFVETGIIGFIGYLWLLCFIFFRTWHHRQGNARVAIGLCVCVALFPLNVHMATYGSFWSSITWWFILLWISVIPQANKHLSR